MHELNILMVDDDAVDVHSVERALRRRGISNPLAVARDGIEALDILLGRGGRRPLPAPRLVLLDLNMPRMDGFEFLAELREHGAHDDDPIFVLTTSDDDTHRARCHEFGVAGYIVKDDLPMRALDLVLLGLQQVPDAELATVDVAAMVRRIHAQLAAEGLFELVLPPSVLVLETAASRLEAVFRVLIQNALDHHDRDFGRVGVSWEELGDVVEFRVQDDGPGISAARARDIFRPLESSKVAQGNLPDVGVGMGLTLARHVVGAAGGSIVAHPTVTRGATFSFTWPIEWPSPVDVPAVSMAELEVGEEFPTEKGLLAPALLSEVDPEAVTDEFGDLPFRVMLVDEDDTVAEGLSRALHRRGHTDALVRAVTAQQALLALQGEAGHAPLGPVMMFLEPHIPGPDGFELLDQIRADPQLCGMPVFVLTGSSDPQDRRSAAVRQVAGFIHKDMVAPDYEAVVALLEAYGRIVRL